jgi:hypothetical protein
LFVAYQQEDRLNASTAKRALIWSLLVLLFPSCINAGSSANHPATTATPTGASGMLSVREAVDWIATLPPGSARQTLTLNARINPTPVQTEGSGSAPVNCPVVVDRLPPLTDDAFATEFSVAGVTLPNLLPKSVPSLKLVIPYRLGIVDLPVRGQLHGHMLDPDYASCPEAKSLFILDRIDDGVGQPVASATSTGVDTSGWQDWSDATVGIGLHYPSGWQVQESRNVGSVVTATFRADGRTQSVMLAVTAGETHWTEEPDSVPPPPLVGDRRLMAQAGPALARLVDVVGDETDRGHQRTIRLVFDYDGNTGVLSMSFIDGLALDPTLLASFTGMAASLTFTKPLGITDPMDPTLTAKSDIGSGPFIGQDTAISLATAISSLTQVTVDDAQLVSEKAARETTPGVCREFSQRPEAVWLVTLSGTKPTGEAARRLVYLDASDGSSICQTDLPLSS